MHQDRYPLLHLAAAVWLLVGMGREGEQTAAHPPPAIRRTIHPWMGDGWIGGVGCLLLLAGLGLMRPKMHVATPDPN